MAERERLIDANVDGNTIPYKKRVAGDDHYFWPTGVEMTAGEVYNHSMALIDAQVQKAIDDGKPLPAQIVSMARNSVRREYDQE